MGAQGIVLVTLAAAFGMGAIAILLAGLYPPTRKLSSEFWALYRSEFIIVGSLLLPAAMGRWVFLGAVLAFLVRAELELFRLFRNPNGRRASPLAFAGAAILVAGLAALTFAPRNADDGFLWIFLVYATVEIGDAFALLCGKLFGRTLVLPRLSPRKTVEGLFCGLLFGAIAGFLLGRYLLNLPPMLAAELALLILAAGLAGDLLTSALKRVYDVKDFSPVLKQHGGVLDIYDSFLLAAPTAYLFRLVFAT